MFKFLEPVRPEPLDLPPKERRRLWLKPFIQSYLVIFAGYAAMYIIRKNFNVAQNDLIETHGLSMTELGTIGLGFSVAYGIGKTLVSYFADSLNTKQVVPFMLILSALAMVGFSLSLGGSGLNVVLMFSFYGLSGFFQSVGGPASYSTVTKWAPRGRRGGFLGLWNVSHNLGGAAAAGVALFGANYFFDGDVLGMFLFPSAVALVVGIVGLFYGNDSPEAYGLGPVEEIFEQELGEEDRTVGEIPMTRREIFVRYILKNRVIWVLAFANVFLYVVRIGVDQWSSVYAYRVLGFSKEVAITGFTLFEVGALVGTLVWGVVSDLAGGRRGLTSMVSLVLIFFTLGFYEHASTGFGFHCSMLGLGFLIFGPQLLIGVAAVGFVPKDAVGVADGFKGTFGYLLGDSFAKLGLGLIADGTPVLGLVGWKGTFTALYGSVTICLILMGVVAIAEERKIRSQRRRGLTLL